MNNYASHNSSHVTCTACAYDLWVITHNNFIRWNSWMLMGYEQLYVKFDCWNWHKRYTTCCVSALAGGCFFEDFYQSLGMCGQEAFLDMVFVQKRDDIKESKPDTIAGNMDIVLRTIRN